MKNLLTALLVLVISFVSSANEASMNDIFDCSLTLEDRVSQMQDGGANAVDGDCDFTSKIELQLLLLTLEAAMAESDRLDIIQGGTYINKFRAGSIYMFLSFQKKANNKFKLELSGAESGDILDIWFHVKGNNVRISSFAPWNLYVD